MRGKNEISHAVRIAEDYYFLSILETPRRDPERKPYSNFLNKIPKQPS